MRNKKHLNTSSTSPCKKQHNHHEDSDASFEVLRRIVDLLPGHVYWYDKEGYFHGSNKQQALSSGFTSSSEIIGENVYSLNDTPDRPILRAANERVLQTGETQTSEEPLLLQDGTRATFLSKKVPWKNNEGDIIGIIGISFDITQDKSSKQGLLQSKLHAENTIKNLLNNLSGHIYIKDLDGKYLYCNQRQADSLGLTINEVIDKTDYDLSEKPLANKFRQIDLTVIRSKQPITAEEKITAEGETRTVLSKKAPFFDEAGKVTGLVGISVDITAEKNAARLQHEKLVAEKQSDVMRMMSSAIAHELRTPQSSIDMVCSELHTVWPTLMAHYEAALKAGNPSHLPMLPEAAYQRLNATNPISRLDKINQHCRTIVNMMNANVLQGKVHGKTIAFKPKDLILEAFRDFPYKNAHEAGLVQGVSGDNFTVMGDPDLFIHVIMNLHKNAIYHVLRSGKGHINVHLATQPDGHYIYFKDTGPGIPPKDLVNIFDNFFTKDTDNGTGIGLALCKNVVKGAPSL